MNRGCTIEIFLVDGDPASICKYTYKNRTILGYKVPRTKLDEAKYIAALKQTGVYFLFGTDDSTGSPLVYVGQAVHRQNGEGLLNRLIEHRRSKDYWTHAVCLTTTDDTLGPTDISFLENRFVTIAKEAGRYEVKNNVVPNIGNTSEETECALEEYIDFAKILMAGAIGEKVFMPLLTEAAPSSDPNPAPSTPLFCTRKETNAVGFRTADGFVVKSGAMISPKMAASCPDYTKKLREQYKEKIDAGFRTTEDILFTSPSSAASFVCGGSVNGNEVWKTESGVPLKDLD